MRRIAKEEAKRPERRCIDVDLINISRKLVCRVIATCSALTITGAAPPPPPPLSGGVTISVPRCSFRRAAWRTLSPLAAVPRPGEAGEADEAR